MPPRPSSATITYRPIRFFALAEASRTSSGVPGSARTSSPRSSWSWSGRRNPLETRTSVSRREGASWSLSRRHAWTWPGESSPRSRARCQTRDSKLRSAILFCTARSMSSPGRILRGNAELLLAEVEGFVGGLGGGPGGDPQRRAALVALDRGAGAEHHDVVLRVALGAVDDEALLGVGDLLHLLDGEVPLDDHDVAEPHEPLLGELLLEGQALLELLLGAAAQADRDLAEQVVLADRLLAVRGVGEHLLLRLEDAFQVL